MAAGGSTAAAAAACPDGRATGLKLYTSRAGAPGVGAVPALAAAAAAACWAGEGAWLGGT